MAEYKEIPIEHLVPEVNEPSEDEDSKRVVEFRDLLKHHEQLMSLIASLSNRELIPYNENTIGAEPVGVDGGLNYWKITVEQKVFFVRVLPSKEARRGGEEDITDLIYSKYYDDYAQKNKWFKVVDFKSVLELDNGEVVLLGPSEGMPAEVELVSNVVSRLVKSVENGEPLDHNKPDNEITPEEEKRWADAGMLTETESALEEIKEVIGQEMYGGLLKKGRIFLDTKTEDTYLVGTSKGPTGNTSSHKTKAFEGINAKGEKVRQIAIREDFMEIVGNEPKRLRTLLQLIDKVTPNAIRVGGSYDNNAYQKYGREHVLQMGLIAEKDGIMIQAYSFSSNFFAYKATINGRDFFIKERLVGTTREELQGAGRYGSGYSEYLSAIKAAEYIHQLPNVRVVDVQLAYHSKQIDLFVSRWVDIDKYVRLDKLYKSISEQDQKRTLKLSDNPNAEFSDPTLPQEILKKLVKRWEMVRGKLPPEFIDTGYYQFFYNPDNDEIVAFDLNSSVIQYHNVLNEAMWGGMDPEWRESFVDRAEHDAPKYRHKRKNKDQ